MNEDESPRGYTKVRDVMTPSPRVIDGLSSVRDAIELMREASVSSLVIERRHEGDEYGVISVRDIAAQVIGENRSPDRTSVYEVMMKPVLTVGVDMDVRYAIRLLSRFRLTRALVVENGDMVGIVTLRDMAIRVTQSS
jgi:signal-transduction protein with cAMP-binding, CBS, and nucleotidyltransferase domain